MFITCLSLLKEMVSGSESFSYCSFSALADSSSEETRWPTSDREEATRSEQIDFL